MLVFQSCLILWDPTDCSPFLKDPRGPAEKPLELIRCLSKSQIQNKYPEISSLLLYKDVGHRVFYNKQKLETT